MAEMEVTSKSPMLEPEHVVSEGAPEEAASAVATEHESSSESKGSVSGSDDDEYEEGDDGDYEEDQQYSPHPDQTWVYEMIGIREFRQVDHSDEHGTAEVKHYHVFLRHLGHVYTLVAKNTYTDCSSGWTSATFGTASPVTRLSQGTTIGTLHFVPKRKGLPVRLHTYISGYGGQTISTGLYVAEAEGTKVTAVEAAPTEEGQDDEGEQDVVGCVVGWDGDGGDHYYPCGSAWITEDFFDKTPRAIEDRPVYVFEGPSAIGKSFLSSHLRGPEPANVRVALTTFNDDLTVYETDTSKKLPKACTLASFHVIVIGNKWPLHKVQVYQRLFAYQKGPQVCGHIKVVKVGMQEVSEAKCATSIQRAFRNAQATRASRGTYDATNLPKDLCHLVGGFVADATLTKGT
jgi:hypothetical protein